MIITIMMNVMMIMIMVNVMSIMITINLGIRVPREVRVVSIPDVL